MSNLIRSGDYRSVHIVAPSVSSSAIACGGTNFYRGFAIALQSLGPTTCYELAHHKGDENLAWKPSDLVVRQFATAEHLLQALAAALVPGAIILKWVGALGTADAEADLAICAMAQAHGAHRFYIDPDAPARLPLIAGIDHYLWHLLPCYTGVILTAGGQRAVAEYRACARTSVHHTSAVLTALSLPSRNPTLPFSLRDYDLITTVAGYSNRESRLAQMLAECSATHPELNIILIGHWPRDMSALETLRILPPRDPLLLNTYYQHSRFTLNLLRNDFSGYSHTAAARVFEAVAAGSCLITEPFPGLADDLQPKKECLVLDAFATLSDALKMTEAQWIEMTGRAAQRLEQQQRYATTDLIDFIVTTCAESHRHTTDELQSQLHAARMSLDLHHRCRNRRIAILSGIGDSVQQVLCARLQAVEPIVVESVAEVTTGDFQVAAVSPAQKEDLDWHVRHTPGCLQTVIMDFSHGNDGRSLRWVPGRDWLVPGSSATWV